jgi:CheY-like chemotaxis protein
MPRVLIVEDDPDQREVYAALLYYNGFDVLQADTAGRGMELARQDQPDAILMDVILPDMDGIVATELLKAAPETAGIPVICMTAYNISPERVIAAGCLDLLHKPVGGHVLVKAIRRQIGWIDATPGS